MKWTILLGVAAALAVLGITVIAGDGTEDPYAEIRERLTTPPPAGELIDTFADSFVDPVPNPCNPAEVDISVEVTGSKSIRSVKP